MLTMRSRQKKGYKRISGFPQACAMFLIVVMSLTVRVQGCPSGWFGRGCLFQCHCFNSTACDINGKCPNNGSCMSGYFGPACQYVDLIVTDVASSTPFYLRDQNDSTCNTDSSATSVQVFLQKALPFTWYRVVVNNNSAMLDIATKVNSRTSCLRELVYGVNNVTVDVWCNVRGILVGKITIEGTVASSICTIQVSGGRNVALKQTASQSSTYPLHHISRAQASNAVDGNTNRDYSQFSCSRTAESYLPYWDLTFNRFYWIPRIFIYTVDASTQRPSPFMLDTFDMNNNSTPWYRESSNISPIVDIILNTREPIKMLKITQTNTQSMFNVSLFLCEVQGMGDAACPWHMYGLECEKSCACQVDIRCSSVTGACALKGPTHICPAGTYGETCSSTCRQHCQYGKCDPLTGDCIACVPGFFGSTCDQECKAGTFGPACKLNCSEQCNNTCDSTTGTCDCKDGFQGSLCTECFPGFFGQKCTKTCLPTCSGNVCDMLTGECVSCFERRAGRYCNDCSEGYYGDSCNVTCPEKCKTGACNITTRECMTCEAGYHGALCTQAEMPKQLHPVFLLTLAFPLFLMVSWWVVGQGKRDSSILFDE